MLPLWTAMECNVYCLIACTYYIGHAFFWAPTTLKVVKLVVNYCPALILIIVKCIITKILLIVSSIADLPSHFLVQKIVGP